MKHITNVLRNTCWLSAALTVFTAGAFGRSKKFTNTYATFTVNKHGYIESARNKQTGLEYSPNGRPSALLTLEAQGKRMLPVSAVFSSKEIRLNTEIVLPDEIKWLI